MLPAVMDIESPAFLSVLSRTASRIDLWTRVVRETGARRMVEIGVWKGDYARDILAACPGVERYYMIDPWARLPDWNKPFNVATEVFDDVVAEAMAKTSFAADRITVLRGRTREVIDQIPDASLDFAYIDGDHTLRGITIDLIRLLPKMREGGIIGGDDFINTPWQHDIRFEPTLVCPFAIYFADAMDLPIVALPHSQFMIQRRAGARFRFLDTTGLFGDVSLNKPPPGRA
jgi:predicted O-methyltransferase YrrM